MSRLGDVCKIDRDQGILEDLPYVGLEDIESGTARFLGTLAPRAVKSTTFRFNETHVLYGRLRPYLNKVIAPDFVGHCSTEIMPLKPFRGLTREYLTYWLLSDQTVSLISETSTGARMPRADMNVVMDIEIPVPPLPEQQRIVAILDEAFEAIATAKANTKKNLQNARALFEGELQALISKGGEGWSEKSLFDVSKEVARGKSRHRPRDEPSLYGGPYPFVQTGDISNSDHWITEYSQTYSQKGLQQSRLWPAGTVCVAIVGATVGESAILNFESCFPDSVIGIITDDRIAINEYVDYLLQGFKDILKEKGKGTARDNINLATFETQRFPFPPLAIQKQTVTKLNELHAATVQLASLYDQKSRQLDSLKSSLLHQAFTGNL